MSATRRTYVKIAAVIAAALTDTDDVRTQAAIANVARGIADAFKQNNPEFRYDRFFPACRLDNWGELKPNPLAFY